MSVRTVVSLYQVVRRLETLLNRLTEQRADLLDNLKWEVTPGTHTHLNSIDEQKAVEILATELHLIEGVLLYMNNLTKETVIRTYIRDYDGVYRRLDIANFPRDFPSGTEVVLINNVSSDNDLKITLQSLEQEGENRSVPYKIVTRSLGG